MNKPKPDRIAIEVRNTFHESEEEGVLARIFWGVIRAVILGPLAWFLAYIDRTIYHDVNPAIQPRILRFPCGESYLKTEDKAQGPPSIWSRIKKGVRTQLAQKLHQISHAFYDFSKEFLLF
jgi:hypothetical protein